MTETKKICLVCKQIFTRESWEREVLRGNDRHWNYKIYCSEECKHKKHMERFKARKQKRHQDATS